MKAIVQKETTGCAIASSAAIAGISYDEAKQIANGLGISAENSALWSETGCIRKLLSVLNIQISDKEVPFTDWPSLPNCALLSVKWRLENGKPCWHWVVFIREGTKSYVLDPKKSLKTNVRTDFWRIKPKWYIKVNA